MSKEGFKEFVKNNPNLVKYVNNNEITWQKFYEMYELYGSNNEIWNNYLDKKDNNSFLSKNEKTITDLVTMIKNVDLDKVKQGIEGVQKTIALVQDLGLGNNNKEVYQPRPIYKHFDD